MLGKESLVLTSFLCQTLFAHNPGKVNGYVAFFSASVYYNLKFQQVAPRFIVGEPLAVNCSIRGTAGVGMSVAHRSRVGFLL